ncbi:hypothetical protein PUNSTDRAFT_134862 [Punctularia strigosozonata HHB-11173 SS5]|uniref:uncharacterized protein n=1 Tax=Punctularia strigosozonata (strain HHB-11173) TaxID=741275 RepID=UPI000441789E|nr:uncharacterized protein PUNSTDRAFT_134862 [Punctularia strigosozonata HHB-11173 SS5]EIN08484.1 hypothetical protein PUNSTDRAFT_134862 [Punctularia strigosozonata HHB-11173 SS5]
MDFNFTSARQKGTSEREEIDEEIETLLKRVRSLRERRNTLAPVSCLPSEILSFIFCICVHDSEAEADTRKFPRSHAFSQVCQFWREVALDTAAIWTMVPRNSLELTETFLSRTKGASLSFMKSKDERPNDEAVRASLQQLSRTQSLTLYADPDIAQYAGNLSVPAPHLVQCTITSTATSRLPDRFLGLHAPRLRTLSLRGFGWDVLHSPLVHGLTDLNLDGIPMDSFPRGEQLVAALKSMPDLTKLALKAAWPPLEELAGPLRDVPRNVVVLDRLTSLELSAAGSYVSHLLAFIRVPPTAFLSVEFLRERTPCDFSSLMDMLANHGTCHKNGPRVWHLVFGFTFDDESHCELAAHTALVTSRFTPALLRVAVPSEHKQTLADIAYAIRGDDIECLEVEFSHPEVHDWATFATQLLVRGERAKELRVDFIDTSKTVIPLLLAPSPVLLPALQRIHFNLASQAPSSEAIASWQELLLQRYKTSNTMLEVEFSEVARLKDEVMDSICKITGPGRVFLVDGDRREAW